MRHVPEDLEPPVPRSGRDRAPKRGAVLAFLAWLAVVGCLVASSRAEAQSPPPAHDAPRLADGAGAPRSAARAPSADAPSEGARTTPRRALAGFLKASSDGDFQKASEFLDLRAVARERRAHDGPELAAMLHRVLTWRVVLDLDQVPDERNVESQRVVLDTVDLDGQAVDITLVRTRIGTDDVWLFSKDTVGAIRALYDANERRWLEDYVPQLLKRGTIFGAAPWQWLGFGALLGLAYVVGRVAGAFVVASLLGAAKRWGGWAAELLRGAGRPLRLALAVFVFGTLEPYLLLPRKASLVGAYAQTTLYIVTAAWLLIALLRIGTTTYEATLPDDTAGHIANRGLRTRLAMVRRIGSVLIGIVAAGVALLQFDVVRTVGLSLLASAGIAGVLVGFAAQRTLGGIISGIEMSITQPLRIGDIVVIDGEWGTVERIFFTYLVLRLYDDRRLIVPVSRVTSAPFENWTRMGSDLLAPVEIFVDLAAPIDAVRAEFERLCRASPLWDGRRADVQVIEAQEKAYKVRGLASVDNASKAFDLRCELREGWVRFLQAHEGGLHIPRSRVESVAQPPRPPLPTDEAAAGATNTPKSP